MISFCPICHLEYTHNPQRCSCGYEGIEPYMNEYKEEYWNKQCFQIYKYTKNVYYKRILVPNDSCSIEEKDDQVCILDVEGNRGLCIIDLETNKKTIVDMGVLALNRKVRSLIINVDTIDTDFLDESIVRILFIGPRVQSFTKGYIRQHSALKYLFVDPKNKYYTSENHVLFNKNMTELICYPSDSNEEEYTVPTSVKKIHAYAFNYPTYLKRLYVQRNVHIDEKMIERLQKQNIEIIIKKGEE